MLTMLEGAEKAATAAVLRFSDRYRGSGDPADDGAATHPDCRRRAAAGFQQAVKDRREFV
jgi:hypothetical protein